MHACNLAISVDEVNYSIQLLKSSFHKQALILTSEYIILHKTTLTSGIINNINISKPVLKFIHIR